MFSCYWVVWVPYVFWIVTPYQISVQSSIFTWNSHYLFIYCLFTEPSRVWSFKKKVQWPMLNTPRYVSEKEWPDHSPLTERVLLFKISLLNLGYSKHLVLYPYLLSSSSISTSPHPTCASSHCVVQSKLKFFMEQLQGGIRLRVR